MLWEHSAAWMAFETLVAVATIRVSCAASQSRNACGTADHSPEQAGEAGYLPLVLDVAGSRVARTMAGATRTVKKLVKCILADVELVILDL